MKYFKVIFLGDVAFLRLKNPLENSRHLISKKAFEEHERLYEAEALRLIDPIPGKSEYTEEEIIEDTSAAEAVYRIVKVENGDRYQDRVQDWIIRAFGTEKAKSISERCFRFLEESVELVQALGMTKDEALRVVVYSFNRTPGYAYEEAGDAIFTLAGLCAAADIDLLKTAENTLESNVSRTEEIKLKHFLKVNQNIAI